MDKSEMLSMSDEDFLKLDSAPEVLPADQQAQTPAVEPVVAEVTSEPTTEQQP